MEEHPLQRRPQRQLQNLQLQPEEGISFLVSREIKMMSKDTWLFDASVTGI